MNFIQKISHKRESILLVSILILASFLRLYRLPYTMQFLGDQGRDALIARGILMERDPAFIGPVTSVGNMYLGPLYYYFMVFPLLLSYPSPVGPAYAVAIFGIVTVALMYVLGKDLIGKRGAMLAAFLYAIAPVVVANVRFSWNPNIVPFFSLILVWCLHQTVQKKYGYWLGVGLCAIALFQLHYITLVLIGCAGLVWIYELVLQLKEKSVRRIFVQMTLLSIVLFFLSLTPIFIFDTKHDFLNVRAFLGFFTGSGETSHFNTGAGISAIFYTYIAVTVRTMTELFGIVVPSMYALLSLAVLVYLGVKTYLFPQSGDTTIKSKRMIGTIFLISIFVLSFYKGSLFDHYLGFIFPIAILVLSTILMRLWDNIFIRPLAVGVIMLFMVFSVKNYPGNQNLGANMFLFRTVAQEIYTRVEPGEMYDILLLSENNDFMGTNYRYFLTTMGNKPADEKDVGNFKKLFVINEIHQENPLNTEQYKLALWPNRDIVDDFTIPGGPRVVVLTRE